jgi:hypothetical protein
VVFVGVDGAGADEEAVGDFLAAQTFCAEVDDFAFTGGKCPLRVGGLSDGYVDAIEQGREVAAEILQPIGYVADRFGEFVPVTALLADETVDARLD